MKCKLHIKNKLIRLLIIVQTVMLWQLPVYAKGGLQKSKVYTGTVNLLNDFKVALIAVEAIVVVVLVIKEGIARQAATDPGEQAQHEKKMKSRFDPDNNGILQIRKKKYELDNKKYIFRFDTRCNK